MTKLIDPREVVSKDPNVDQNEIKKALETLKALRDQGLVQDKGYDLAPPFSRPSPAGSDRHIRSRLRICITRKDR